MPAPVCGIACKRGEAPLASAPPLPAARRTGRLDCGRAETRDPCWARLRRGKLRRLSFMSIAASPLALEAGIAAATAAGRPDRISSDRQKMDHHRLRVLTSRSWCLLATGSPHSGSGKGDLTLIELARHVQGVKDNVDQQRERVEQYEAILPFLMNDEEEARSSALQMTVEAWRLERKKQQAAIDQDIAAGRCRTWSPVMTEKDNRWCTGQLEEAVEFLDKFIGRFVRRRSGNAIHHSHRARSLARLRAGFDHLCRIRL